MSANYGARRSYNGGPYPTYHEGVDFSAYAGTPVMAPAAGTVALAEPLTVRGGAVILDHGLGVYTGYYHLSAIHATVGQQVQPGDVLGEAGMKFWPFDRQPCPLGLAHQRRLGGRRGVAGAGVGLLVAGRLRCGMRRPHTHPMTRGDCQEGTRRAQRKHRGRRAFTESTEMKRGFPCELTGFSVCSVCFAFPPRLLRDSRVPAIRN